MRPLVFGIASFTLSLAFQITLAKYGADVPDIWIFVLWVFPLLPFAWWAWTHDKVLSRREKLRQYFKLHFWRGLIATLATASIMVACLAGMSYTGWRMWRERSVRLAAVPISTTTALSQQQTQSNSAPSNPQPGSQKSSTVKPQPNAHASKSPAPSKSHKSDTDDTNATVAVRHAPGASVSNNVFEGYSNPISIDKSPGVSANGNVFVPKGTPVGVVTTGPNSPAVGSITQGAGSIAQVGGSGNQATVNNNFGLADRHLSSETSDAIAALVKEYIKSRGGTPGIRVLTVANGEAESFADDLARMLWTLRAADLNRAIVGEGWWPQSPTGVTVNVKSENDSNFGFAKQLAETMKNTGVPAVAVRTNSGMEVGDIYLVVGDKTTSDPIGAATRNWLFR